MRRWIVNFKNSEHYPLQIYDGISRKVRVIICPSTKEQIIHHAIVQILEPIIMKGMYPHTYASIPGRGGLKGQKILKKWIKNDPSHVKYCAKYDIKQYFPSVDHNILKRLMAKKIHDEKMLAILYEIVDVVDKGIPLGFYASQWFANRYLQELDHYIKEELKIAHYDRYMDEMLHVTRIVSSASKQEKMSIYNCRRILSMMGWITHTDTYHMYEERIATKVNIQNCKRRVATYDRRLVKQQKQKNKGGIAA